MTKRCEVVWWERDRVLVRSVARALRVAAAARADLIVHAVAREADAAAALARADRLVVGADGVFERVLASWRARRGAPACVIADDVTPSLVQRLRPFDALPLTKLGVVRELRQLARLIVGAAPPRAPLARATPPLEDRVLDELGRLGVTFAAFDERLRRAAIVRALAREPSIARAATVLGVSRTTLVSQMHKLGLTHEASTSARGGRLATTTA